MNRWWLVVAAGLGVLVAQLDATAVNVALPVIERETRTGPGLSTWVVLGYVLPLVALSLPVGRWLDRVGQKPALVLSVTGFAAASAGVGLAPAIGWLIAARVVQGAFGAALFALLPVITATAVRQDFRGRAMSLVMTLGPLGAVLGPPLGGLLVDTIGWPWIFYLNLPVSALIVAIAPIQLPSGRLVAPDRGWLAEIGVLTGATTALLLVPVLPWTGLLAIPFLLSWRRMPASAPVRELFRTPGVASAHAALLLEIAAIVIVQFIAPFFLQGAGISAGASGLAVFAFPAAVLVVGPVAGVFADRLGARTVLVFAAAILTFGLVLTVFAAPSAVDIAWRLVIAGVGAGLFGGPVMTLAMDAAPARLLGLTGASTSTFRQIGLALGPSVASAAWSSTGYSVAGIRIAFGCAVFLAALSLVALSVRAG
ncbi:MFS transporter [Fodinicola acaciae]|uniref:MFS transporter n=1 Tax=Fodinicola acaciae TaxID=2681555 RepID=UPI0013D489D9|nr:MFS transporter [Fodinicola acaciae]